MASHTREIFERASDLKRAYEFFANPKTSLSSVCQPYHLQTAAQIKEPESFEVYGVYAVEIDPPEGCEPVEWMILTPLPVTNGEQAPTILRWYTYRWRIEEYHKILKSGCKAESYRLSGDSMQVLLGFLTNIAAPAVKNDLFESNRTRSTSIFSFK